MGSNSIQCKKCTKWIHKNCSGMKGKLKPDPNLHCKSCSSGIQDLPIVNHKELDMDEPMRMGNWNWYNSSAI